MNSKPESEAHLFIDCTCTLAEGPVWHDDSLWWVDIEEGRLHRQRASSGGVETVEMPERIGFAVPAHDASWLVGLASGIYRWDPQSKELSEVAAPEKASPNTRFNDGKVSPDGRLWAGTMDLKAAKGQGALYRLDTLGCAKVIGSVSISNGLAWDTSGTTFYYVDTPTRQITAYDHDPGTGAISNRRVIFTIPEALGAPDGMTIDSEGCLWVALWGGAAVIRVDPTSGEILHTVRVPAPRVTSCTFGGEDLGTLYITTARSGMDEAELQTYPQAGGIFTIRPGAKGAPVTLHGEG